ncbi:MAG TPA: right-handed parallel beta-helix repeat-containing protein [Puia sp.]|nr:right-handed parallel beta-helix repeat-containing protein [Puia sp.]
MQIVRSQLLASCLKITGIFAVAGMLFSSCSKNNSSASTGVVLPGNAIRGTIIAGGNIKGTMLADSTYTLNGDVTVLKTDTLIIQAGAKIVVPANHAFYIQGIIASLGTATKPVVFTAPIAQPGQWGGFQCDSAKAVTFLWTKILWAGGPDSSGGTRQTIGVSSPIPVDIEDCWFVGGQDNSIGVYSTANVTILRNSFYGNGTTDGDCIDFHSGVTGVVAYNCLWGSAGSAIKVYTSATVQNPQTNVIVYNNTCVESGFRRGAAEPGRGVLVDAFSRAQVYNNLLANNYWSLDITTTADYAHTTYNNNYFFVTVDSLRQFMYPAGEKGTKQSGDIIDSVHLGANDPKFVGYTTPPNPATRIIPTSFDFHLQSGSPALGKGYTGSVSLPAGAPALSTDIGAYVSDTTGGKGNRHAAGY